MLAVFWGTERAPIHSQANVAVRLQPDTGEHVYRLELAKHSRWRGLVRRLRVDPCQAPGHTVRNPPHAPAAPEAVDAVDAGGVRQGCLILA